MSSKTVNLIVGPKRKTFVAHKDLHTHLVPYITEVVSSQLLSSNNDDIYIGSSDPAAAQVFVGWLYRGPSALGVRGKGPSSSCPTLRDSRRIVPVSTAEQHNQYLDHAFSRCPRPEADKGGGGEVLPCSPPVSEASIANHVSYHRRLQYSILGFSG